MKQLLAGR